MKVLSVFGTRPEAIKMCPLIKKIENNKEIQNIICLTGQHKEMLQQVMDIFKIVPQYNLDIMKKQQTLASITSSILFGLDEILKAENPDLVLVHGDTTTAFAAALGSYYRKIPVGHIEAGLRTGDKYSPYPEELNRQMIARIAELHFAPTKQNAENLMKENINENIFITGNTVIDSMSYTIKEKYIFKNLILNNIDYSSERIVLLTAHRRENWGEGLENILTAVQKLVRKYEDIKIIYPVHLNPIVREHAERILKNMERVYLIDPLDIEDMHNLINSSFLIMTDSGGIQEEAPFCGKPVVVLRNETERKEAVIAGTVVIAGTEEKEIISVVESLLNDQEKYHAMKRAINPYGDGYASERIVKHILEWYYMRKKENE